MIGFERSWYDRYDLNYKDFTRHMMEKLEQRKGMKLERVTAEHLKEKSPHVHLAIKA